MTSKEVKERLKDAKMLNIVDEVCKLTNETYDEGEKDGRENQLEEDRQEYEESSEFMLLKYETVLEYLSRVRSGENLEELEKEVTRLICNNTEPMGYSFNQPHAK